MNAARSLFPSTMLGLALLSFLLLCFPVSSFATEPHVCIGGHPATQWQNLGSNSQISWGYGGACGHSSNVNKWYFFVYNYYNQTTPICSATNGGAGWTIPPDTELHNVVASTSCTGGTIPKGATVKLKARVWYQVAGSTWMYFDDWLTNF